MTTGERIRIARQQAGLTQKQLGEACGIAEPTIRRYELDKLNPKTATLKKIASALGVTWYDLYEGGEEIKKTSDLFLQYATAIQQKAAIETLGKAVGEKNVERIIIALDYLNDDGKQKAVERVEELTEIPRYQRLHGPLPSAEGTDTTEAEKPATDSPDGKESEDIQ